MRELQSCYYLLGTAVSLGLEDPEEELVLLNTSWNPEGGRALGPSIRLLRQDLIYLPMLWGGILLVRLLGRHWSADAWDDILLSVQ